MPFSFAILVHDPEKVLCKCLLNKKNCNSGEYILSKWPTGPKNHFGNGSVLSYVALGNSGVS